MSYWTSPENISRAKNCNERLHETNSRAENRNYARSHGLPLQKCAPTLVQAPMHVQKLWASVVETFRHTNVYRTNVATIWCRCRNLWQVLLKLLAMPSLYVQPSPTSFVCAHTSGSFLSPGFWRVQLSAYDITWRPCTWCARLMSSRTDSSSR